MKRNYFYSIEEQRDKNADLPTTRRKRSFLQDPYVSVCTYDIYKGKKYLEENSQNLCKELYNLEL